MSIVNKITEKIKRRSIQLKKINGREPKLIANLFLKSPERGYFDEFEERYLSGELILKVFEDNFSEDTNIQKILNRNSKFIALLDYESATELVNCKKMNRNDYFKIGKPWFNGEKYVAFVFINTGMVNQNRYIRDILEEYKEYSLTGLNKARTGETPVLGHIVSKGSKKIKDERYEVFKILTSEKYICVGILDRYNKDSSFDIGDLVSFTATLRASKKSQSQAEFIGAKNIQIVKKNTPPIPIK